MAKYFKGVKARLKATARPKLKTAQNHLTMTTCIIGKMIRHYVKRWKRLLPLKGLKSRLRDSTGGRP